MNSPAQPAPAPAAPVPPVSPEARRLAEQIAVEELRLRHARLPLEDAAARALSNKQISDSETAVAKALLPTTLDTATEKDALTVSGEPTGLTGVYVHRAAVALAEDVADLVLKALPQAAAEVLVVHDGAVLDDLDTLHLLNARLRLLEDRLNRLCPPTAEAADPVLMLAGPSLAAPSLAALSLAGPAIAAAAHLVPSGSA